MDAEAKLPSVMVYGGLTLSPSFEDVEVVTCPTRDALDEACEGVVWPLVVTGSALLSTLSELPEALIVVACEDPDEGLAAGAHIALPLWDSAAASLALRSALSVREHLKGLHERAALRQSAHEDFVHAVSHDLKGPLQGIMGLAGLLMEQSGVRVFPEVGAYASRIEGEAERLASMVSALTAYTRLGQTPPALGRVSLSGLIDELSASAIRRHTERFPRFQIAPALPDVHADEALLRNAISALIDNAVAFSEAQPITIKVELESAEDGRCVLVIADEGIGVPEHALESVFDLFTRLDKRRGDGIGVGLTMARKSVELCQGSLTLESNFGAWTRARVTLHLAD